MRRFIFGGPDSLSDIGGWQVVIIARDSEEAEKYLSLHLAELNRKDVKRGNQIGVDYSITGVVYSNVEPGRPT